MRRNLLGEMHTCVPLNHCGQIGTMSRDDVVKGILYEWGNQYPNQVLE